MYTFYSTKLSLSQVINFYIKECFKDSTVRSFYIDPFKNDGTVIFEHQIDNSMLPGEDLTQGYDSNLSVGLSLVDGMDDSEFSLQVARCESIGELRAVIARIKSIRGTRDTFTVGNLNALLNLIESGEKHASSITRSCGLRGKVMELMFYREQGI